MTLPFEWKQTRSVCPSCGGMTEEAESGGGIVCAERCPRCKWQGNFVPSPRPVLFGRPPYELEEVGT